MPKRVDNVHKTIGNQWKSFRENLKSLTTQTLLAYDRKFFMLIWLGQKRGFLGGCIYFFVTNETEIITV